MEGWGGDEVKGGELAPRSAVTRNTQVYYIRWVSELEVASHLLFSFYPDLLFTDQITGTVLAAYVAFYFFTKSIPSARRAAVSPLKFLRLQFFSRTQATEGIPVSSPTVPHRQHYCQVTQSFPRQYVHLQESAHFLLGQT